MTLMQELDALQGISLRYIWVNKKCIKWLHLSQAKLSFRESTFTTAWLFQFTKHGQKGEYIRFQTQNEKKGTPTGFNLTAI